jgi:hypothetical protein
VFGLEAVAETLCSKVAGGIARQAERLGYRWSKKRIAEGIQNQGQRAFRHMMGLMANGELRDEAADGTENGVERITVAGQDHPCGERARAFLAECIETLIDDHPRVGLSGASPFDGIGNASVDRIGDRFCKLALKPGGGAKVVEQVRMSPSDLAGDRLQRHRLRALLDEKLARRTEGCGATFFRGEAGSSY